MPQTTRTTGTEGDLRYLVSSPAGPPTGDELRPVLVFLHGQGEAFPLPLDHSADLHGPLAATAWAAARERFLIIEPERSGRQDDWIADLDAVVEIARRATRDHAGDPARTYLTGFSLGGNGVLDFAARGPEMWTAYWSVDPARLPSPAPPPTPRHPMWVSAGPLTKRNSGYRQMKDAGTDDAGNFPVSDEGDNHVQAAARAYGAAKVYEWLLLRRR